MISAVPYLRVSTDDKGQVPERQMDVIDPWAEREGVTLLAAEVDEGTSASKRNPFERKRFIAACERAKDAGATAIVVECSDRFSRQGSKRDAWAEVELEERYGLRLFRADKPLDQHGSMVGAVTDTMNAEGAAAWVKGHSSKVRSGMAKARKDGVTFGRPPKPLTPAEHALVAKLRADGQGWRRCALAVSEARGAFKVADPDRRRKLTVSHSHVRRSVEASGQARNKSRSGTKVLK
jgi:DNA invertase Pin-like site-specific DNA recombinase